MANIGDDAHGTNGESSLNQSITNTNKNVLEPTVYKFSSNITRKGGLEEEYFVDLTAYARLHDKHTRMLDECNKPNKSFQRIKELENKNVRLQQMNDSLKQKLFTNYCRWVIGLQGEAGLCLSLLSLVSFDKGGEG